MGDSVYDVIVVGSGAAGLTTAVVAAHFGLKVVVLEKTGYVGGSTAVSGGAIWIPGTRHDGASDRAEVLTYLRAVLANRGDPDCLQTFLDEGPRAIDFLEANTTLRFQSRPLAPDYRSETAGAALAGRTIDIVPFDGRQLGEAFDWIRPPTREFLAFGGMMVNRRDIDALLTMTRTRASFRHATGLLLRYARDLLRYRRGTRLVMGNGLVGRLLKSVLNAGIELRREANVEDLIRDDRGAIRGVIVSDAGKMSRIAARHGVVLATGGFPSDAARARTLLPHADVHRTVAPPSNTGDGIRLGLGVGARLAEHNVGPVLLAPVSVLKEQDGAETVFPHLILDRQKPGLVAVNDQGRRFVNEACCYHDFVLAMYGSEGAVPAHLVCDSTFLRRYGLGLVRPRAFRRRRFVAAGYLREASTLESLADQIGIDARGLRDTVERNNIAAGTGVDKEFGKGRAAYDRHLGDPARGPNPCLGSIVSPPFYAVTVYPGDIGSALGLVTDNRARVIGSAGAPIPGLFCCGADMNSIFAGTYPGSGITLGPALTFGYVAGMELVNASKQSELTLAQTE